MYNKQSLKPKRRQFSNLKTDRRVENNHSIRRDILRNVVAVIQWDFVPESLMNVWNVTATVSFSKRVLRSLYWTELVFYIFYVSTNGDFVSAKCRINV
jgi:hypothetical protein